MIKRTNNDFTRIRAKLYKIEGFWKRATESRRLRLKIFKKVIDLKFFRCYLSIFEALNHRESSDCAHKKYSFWLYKISRRIHGGPKKTLLNVKVLRSLYSVREKYMKIVYKINWYSTLFVADIKTKMVRWDNFFKNAVNKTIFWIAFAQCLRH